jgi:hypothetical protein
MRNALASFLFGVAILPASVGAQANPIVTTPAKKTSDVCRERARTGPRSEAIDVCERMLENDGSPPALAAMVRALMSGDAQPTTEDLGRANMMARAIHRRAPGTLWGFSADCDIAAKLRDLGALKACRAALIRLAPADLETARASAEFEELRTPTYAWLAWWTLGIACAAALGHAAFRPPRGRTGRTKQGATVAAAVVLLHLVPGAARAGTPLTGQAASSSPIEPATAPDVGERKGLSKWAIDKTNPENSVPSAAERDKNPLEYGYFIMDLAALGQRAIRLGDHRAAVKYYRAVAKAAPERSIGFTKLCDEYEALGEIDHAIAACRMAIARPGATPSDFDDFIRLAFARPGKLHPSLAMDLEDVVDELRNDPKTKAAAERINCELGARTRNVKRLEACIPTLGKGSENDPRAVTFRWILALEHKNYGEAEALVAQAGKTGMKPDGVEKMRAATLAAEPFFRRWLGTWQRALTAFALLVVVGGIAFAARRSAKARTLAAPPKARSPRDHGSAPTTA